MKKIQLFSLNFIHYFIFRTIAAIYSSFIDVANGYNSIDWERVNFYKTKRLVMDLIIIRNSFGKIFLVG